MEPTKRCLVVLVFIGLLAVCGCPPIDESTCPPLDGILLNGKILHGNPDFLFSGRLRLLAEKDTDGGIEFLYVSNPKEERRTSKVKNLYQASVKLQSGIEVSDVPSILKVEPYRATRQTSKGSGSEERSRSTGGDTSGSRVRRRSGSGSRRGSQSSIEPNGGSNVNCENESVTFVKSDLQKRKRSVMVIYNLLETESPFSYSVEYTTPNKELKTYPLPLRSDRGSNIVRLTANGDGDLHQDGFALSRIESVYQPTDTQLILRRTNPDWQFPEELVFRVKYVGRTMDDEQAKRFVYLPQSEITFKLDSCYTEEPAAKYVQSGKTEVLFLD